MKILKGISATCMSVFFLMTGCSLGTSGYIGHGIMTNVQLEKANYTVIKSVTGAAADYYFGIGPEDEDLVGRAKRDMITKAELM